MKEEPFVLGIAAVKAALGPCPKGGVHQPLRYQERSKRGDRVRKYLVVCQACGQTWSVTDDPPMGGNDD